MLLELGARSRREAASLTLALHGGSLTRPWQLTKPTRPLIALVGAGVDHALTGRALWSDLLIELMKELNIGVPYESLVRDAAPNWPLEAAQTIRSLAGTQNYDRALRRVAASLPLTGSDMKSAIESLDENGVRVWVTLNYSGDLVEVLRHRRPLKIDTISTLHSTTPSELLREARGDRNRVIALHGSVASLASDSLVLDRSSYTEAVFGAQPYWGFLTTLLAECSTLSMGLSWTDPLLREAAAEVRRSSPTARYPQHVQVDGGAIGSPAEAGNERMLFSAYGVRPVRVAEHSSIPSLLRSIAEPIPEPSQANRLTEVRAFLDRTGDYESTQHDSWMGQKWESVVRAVLRRTGGSPSFESWLEACAVERHLRHIVWMYGDNGSFPRGRHEIRRVVWERLAAHIDRFERQIGDRLQQESQEWYQTRNRPLFDFLIGHIETMPTDKHLAERWRVLGHASCAHSSSPALQRLGLAGRVWSGGPASSRSSGGKTLRAGLRDAEWESVEAKVALDDCESLVRGSLLGPRGPKMRAAAESVRGLDPQTRTEVLTSALDAHQLAQLAGCQRRSSGALVLASLAQDPSDAAATLKGILQARHEPSPVSTWNAMLGFTALLADSDKGISPDAARRTVELELGVIAADEACGPNEAVARQSVEFWSSYHKGVRDLAPSAYLTGPT